MLLARFIFHAQLQTQRDGTETNIHLLVFPSFFEQVIAWVASPVRDIWAFSLKRSRVSSQLLLVESGDHRLVLVAKSSDYRRGTGEAKQLIFGTRPGLVCNA